MHHSNKGSTMPSWARVSGVGVVGTFKTLHSQTRDSLNFTLPLLPSLRGNAGRPTRPWLSGSVLQPPRTTRPRCTEIPRALHAPRTTLSTDLSIRSTRLTRAVCVSTGPECRESRESTQSAERALSTQATRSQQSVLSTQHERLSRRESALAMSPRSVASRRGRGEPCCTSTCKAVPTALFQ